MAYVKQEWKNLPNQTTPTNATRMNHIEDGIYNNSVEISNIIESGSNSNGNWIKYSDGTMICWGYYEKKNIAINKTFGSLYECQSFNLGDFSQNFAEIPRVTITKLGSVCAWIESLDNVTRSSLGTANWVRPTAGTYTLAYSYTAIGRWK